MRFISLFAGIGGIDLGLERVGWRCVAQVEIDPYCRAVLAKHWPDVPRFGDISGVSVRDLPPTDALVGGFPCQPVSVAGSRRGHADERWLWPEFYRLVRELRPRWICAENVPGLRTLGADGVIQDLESCGYAVWPLVVGADDVGAPHRRKRVFVVAHRDDPGLDRIGLAGLREGLEEHGTPSERGSDPDGRDSSVPDLADADLAGRGEQRGAIAIRAEQLSVKRGGHAWPSRPGEPQYEWEPPRLVYSARTGRVRAPELENDSQGERGGRGSDPSVTSEVRGEEQLAYGGSRHGQGRGARNRRGFGGESETEAVRDARDGDGRPESRLGVLPDGLPRHMAPRDRRARLKALGNAVVPACAEMIGRAILHLDYSKSGV